MSTISYKIEAITISALDDEVIWKLVDFSHLRYKEQNPGDPLPSRDFTFNQLKEPRRYNIINRFIAWDENKEHIIASAGLLFMKPHTPGFEENKHRAIVWLSVLPEYRRQGLGITLITRIIQTLNSFDQYEVTHLEVWIDSDIGRSFLKKLNVGYISQEFKESRLNLSEVDWDKMQQWIDEGKTRANGTTLEIFDHIPDEILEKFCEIYTNLLNSMPKAEDPMVFSETPEIRRVKEEKHKKLGGMWITAISRSVEGDISGLTEFLYNPNEPHVVYQELTGVLSTYQGRGLGKWLKAELLFYMRNKLPEAKVVSTGNASDNGPMLAINTQMGFKQHKHGILYRFTKEEMQQFV